jgi:deoxyribodipyrimidine photo-lyase
MRVLHWFRADLRIQDNTALASAIEDGEAVIAVFIITPLTWQRHDTAAVKVQFLLDNLRLLSTALAKRGIPLLIRSVDYFSQCPEVLAQLCADYKIEGLYFNKQYEYDEQRRDELVLRRLASTVTVKAFEDQVLLPPGEVLSLQGKPLQIFTPFKNKWLALADQQQAWFPVNIPRKKFTPLAEPDPIPAELSLFKSSIALSYWPAGEAEASRRLNAFCSHSLLDYQKNRDFPALSGTSQLSPYLALGVISPRTCITEVMDATQSHQLTDLNRYAGAMTWVSELIWREFYKHILFFYPQVCRDQPFRKETDNIPWRYDEDLLQAWQQGQTGFPLVDAAMRQLNQTGWMHNRLRMVVAMFLSKTLFLNWRLGEKYFMQHLIDGDFSANNGGWQWSASTGTDSVPYFRIFNPTTQSERFDSEGLFIRRYCPELAALTSKMIHDPYARGAPHGSLTYPDPIVDYKKMRALVIAAFKEQGS